MPIPITGEFEPSGGAGSFDLYNPADIKAGNINVVLTLVSGGKITANGINGQIVMQTGAGAPSHSADEGVPYWDTTNNVLYVNNNGSTGWTAITDAAALAAHLADTIDAHDASSISLLDAAGDFTADNVEDALQELQADAEAHLADTTPHDIFITQRIVFMPEGANLATGVLMPPRTCTGESGEHGTYVAIRAKATCVAGSGTNTILIEADDDPAFPSAVTLYTLNLGTSVEVDDTTLDTAWAVGDIFIRARCTAVDASPPTNVVVEFYYKQKAEVY